LLGVWVWSSNFCPHHALMSLGSRFWEPSASNSMNPSWLDRNSINGSTSFWKRRPIGFKILSRLTCLGSRFVSWLIGDCYDCRFPRKFLSLMTHMNGRMLTVAISATKRGSWRYQNFDPEPGWPSPFKLFKPFGSPLPQSLPITEKWCLKRHRKQSKTKFLPCLWNGQDPKPRLQTIPCLMSANRSVESCEHWIWSHPSDKLYLYPRKSTNKC
jgi:hypothetical protein